MQYNEKAKKPDVKTQRGTVARLARQAGQVPSGCKACGRKGLPVLPLRVAAVPVGVAGSQWRPEVPVPPVALSGGEYKYALRTLRMGYLYVLLDREIWQAYEVTEEGYLRQFDPLVVPEGETVAPLSPACLNAGHHVQASFISLDTEQFSEAWLAFSSDPWSLEVLEGYRTGSRPASRFTQVNLKSAGETPAVKTLERTLSALKSGVVEFATDFYPSVETGGTPGGAHGFYGRRQDEARYSAYVETLQRSYGQVLAIAVEDSVGVVQELNDGRLQLVEARQKYNETPEIRHKHLIAQVISQYLASLKQAIEETSTPAYGRPSSGYPATTVQVMTKAEVAAGRYKMEYERLQKSYDEAAHAAFVQEHQQTLARWQQRIEAVGSDLAAWCRSDSWLTAVRQDYTPELSLLSWSRQFITLGLCTRGSLTDPHTEALWQSWLEDTTSPAWLGLLGPRQANLDAVFAGSAGFGYLKTSAGSDEVSKFVSSNPGRRFMAERTIAMSGAMSRLGNKVAQGVESGWLRVLQGINYLAEGKQTTVFSLQMTVGEFQQLNQEIVNTRLSLVNYPGTFAGSLQQGQQTVKTAATGGVMQITDPTLLNMKLTVTLSTDMPWQEYKEALKKSGTSPQAVERMPLTKPGYLQHFSELRVSSLSLPDNASNEVVLLNAAQRQALIKQHTQMIRRVVSGNTIGLTLALGMFSYQMKELKATLDSMESPVADSNALRLTLLSKVVMVSSAVAESGGFFRTLTSEKPWGAYSRQAHILVRAGGVLAGVSAIIDGFGMFFKASDVYDVGDSSWKWYVAGGALNLIGGGFAACAAVASNFALLGPAGLALLLIFTGALLVTMGDKARSTAFEIWLRRCCFGRPRDSDVVWQVNSIEDLNTALSAWNALVSGMTAEVVYQDLPTELFTCRDIVAIKITLPSYSDSASAWQYSLEVGSQHGPRFPLKQASHNVTPFIENKIFTLPEQKFTYIKTAERKEKDALIIEWECEVDRVRYNKAVLYVVYWPDKNDAQCKLALQIEIKD